jgi:hypothetical protein
VKKQPLIEVPTKLVSSWLPEHRAVLDEWANYFVTLAEFRTNVFGKALDYSRAHQGRAWIVDGSKAKGVFNDEIQQFIATQGFKLFFAAGVRSFISIRSQVSSATNLSIARYEKLSGPAGVSLVTVNSVDDALAYLVEVDTGKTAA